MFSCRRSITTLTLFMCTSFVLLCGEKSFASSGGLEGEDGYIVGGAIIIGTAGTFAISGLVYALGEAYGDSKYPNGGWESSYWVTWGMSMLGLAIGIAADPKGYPVFAGPILGAGFGYYLSFEAPDASENTKLFFYSKPFALIPTYMGLPSYEMRILGRVEYAL